jgi:acetyl-CoA carboxylase alpha subunit
MAAILDITLQQALADLEKLPVDKLLEQRYQKFRTMGRFFKEAS